MVRRARYATITLLLVGGLVIGIGWFASWFAESAAQASEPGACPPGYSHYVVLEPAQDATRASNIVDQGCKPVEAIPEVVLSPIQPGTEEIKPYEPTRQSDIVWGPSKETVYRCVIFLEPLRTDEESSRSSKPVCSAGAIDTVDGHALDSSYLIARFYDNTDYGALLVEYYGAAACSSTVSYGVTSLPGNLDNQFASGQSYSNCNVITVYDFTNYGGPNYTCGPDCSSFHALNDHVSSWRTSQ